VGDSSIASFDPQLLIERSVVGRRVVLRLDGEVDLVTAPQLQEAVAAALDDGALELWLDFTPTAFMDSTGLHVLLEARGRSRDRNRRLAVICADGSPVHRLLVMAGADAVLTIHPDVGAAQRAA
jgi:anti-sigma B factor antagonist